MTLRCFFVCSILSLPSPVVCFLLPSSSELSAFFVMTRTHSRVPLHFPLTPLSSSHPSHPNLILSTLSRSTPHLPVFLSLLSPPFSASALRSRSRRNARLHFPLSPRSSTRRAAHVAARVGGLGERSRVHLQHLPRLPWRAGRPHAQGARRAGRTTATEPLFAATTLRSRPPRPPTLSHPPSPSLCSHYLVLLSLPRARGSSSRRAGLPAHPRMGGRAAGARRGDRPPLGAWAPPGRGQLARWTKNRTCIILEVRLGLSLVRRASRRKRAAAALRWTSVSRRSTAPTSSCASWATATGGRRTSTSRTPWRKRSVGARAGLATRTRRPRRTSDSGSSTTRAAAPSPSSKSSGTKSDEEETRRAEMVARWGESLCRARQ